jgi:hypothetical protein
MSGAASSGITNRCEPGAFGSRMFCVVKRTCSRPGARRMPTADASEPDTNTWSPVINVTARGVAGAGALDCADAGAADESNRASVETRPQPNARLRMARGSCPAPRDASRAFALPPSSSMIDRPQFIAHPSSRTRAQPTAKGACSDARCHTQRSRSTGLLMSVRLARFCSSTREASGGTLLPCDTDAPPARRRHGATTVRPA